MASEMSITKKMLATLRKGRDEQARRASQVFVKEEIENDNFLTRSKILMEEALGDKKKVLTEEEEMDNDHNRTFEVSKDTPQFGDVRTSQEEGIRKTVNDNVKFEKNALVYYPDADDMTLNGKIPSLNLTFQFRYNDPSFGCYIWCEALVLNDENARTIGKIKDAFQNWKDSITKDADLMEKLKQAANNRDEQ